LPITTSHSVTLITMVEIFSPVNFAPSSVKNCYEGFFRTTETGRHIGTQN